MCEAEYWHYFFSDAWRQLFHLNCMHTYMYLSSKNLIHIKMGLTESARACKLVINVKKAFSQQWHLYKHMSSKTCYQCPKVFSQFIRHSLYKIGKYNGDGLFRQCITAQVQNDRKSFQLFILIISSSQNQLTNNYPREMRNL